MSSSLEKHLVDALPRLFGYAFKLTREPDAARDLVQQCAVQALASAEGPRDERAVIPWLLRIVRNAFLDGRRREKVRGVSGCEDELGDRWGDDAQVRALSIKQALERLDVPCRDVVELVDMHGLTYREAAERLNVPIGTVMSRLSRARRQLLAIITQEIQAQR